MKTAFVYFTALSAALVEASTIVTVLEFGKGGTVRRTTSDATSATVSGVTSFWSGLHSLGNKFQPAGMTVVPDLFNKPEGGLVLGVSGVDLETMPKIASLIDGKSDSAIGRINVQGAHSNYLLSKVGGSEKVTVSDLMSSAKRETMSSGLSALSIAVEKETVGDVDFQVDALVKTLRKAAAGSDSTFVLHLVVQEDEGAARRRLVARRLEQSGNQGDRNLEDAQEEDNADAEEDGNDDGNNANGNGYYYGYGYYDANGDFKTTYKTMFQIQYFNIVLWTSVILVVAAAGAIFMVVDMPLEADTLLFGESAKMMGE